MKTESAALATRCVHAGREDLQSLGCHAPPIDLSSTYPIGDADTAERSYDELASGAPSAAEAVYSRLHNPTVARYERAIASLEGAEDAVAFASGMAAMTACLLAIRETHSHLVAIRPLYGGTDHLLDSGRVGVDVSWAAADTVAAEIRPGRTGLVVCETPQNPTLGQVDIAAVVAAAGDVPVLVDNTFATPVLQRPLDHGAAIVLHSATKALGGHGDVLGGIVAADEAWARRIRSVRAITGGVLHPFAAYLLHRSLQTLELRVLRAQTTAQALAERLREHPEVSCVHYPGLGDGAGSELLGRQLQGPGSTLAFELRGGHVAARTMLRALTVVTPAASLGGAESLIQIPAGLTHRILGPGTLEALGISGATMRLSVGLEDLDDLWADLSSGLERSALGSNMQSASKRS